MYRVNRDRFSTVASPASFSFLLAPFAPLVHPRSFRSAPYYYPSPPVLSFRSWSHCPHPYLFISPQCCRPCFIPVTLSSFISSPSRSSSLARTMTAFSHSHSHRPHRHLLLPRPTRRRPLALDRPAQPSTPIPTPSSSSSASTSSHISVQPNWSEMSSVARQILSTIPPATHPRNFQAAIQPHISRHPRNPFLWHALLTRIGAHYGRDHGPLLSLLEQALSHVPSGSRGALYHFRASIHLHRGELPAALRILSDAVATDPYPLLYVALATTHTRRQDMDRARDAYRAGVNAFPRNAPLWRSWAYFEASHGSREAALHTCREALDRDPCNPRAWRMLLQLQVTFGAGDAHLADVLQEALTACPLDPVLRLQLARIEERRKGLRAARAVLAPIERVPHPDVMRTLGRILFQQGDHARARVFLRRAADCESRPNLRSKSTGSDEDEDGENDSALSSRKNRHSRSHKAVKALHAWALMESKVGNIDEARTLLAEARALCQTDAGIWRAIAELESRERNFEVARKAFQSALAIDPNDPRVLLAWGRTEVLAGDMLKAEALIAKLDKLPPNRRKTVKHLAKRIESERISALFNLKDREMDGGDDSKLSDHNASDDYSSNNVSLTPHVLAAALRERAILASQDGRFEDSVRLLTRASVVEPGNEVGWRLLASQELRRKGIERLREVYRLGLDQVAQRCKYKLLHWWGQDERSHGNVNEARELFRKATLASPDYMSAWMSWGLMEKSVGRVDEACAIFEQATRRAEEDAIRAPFIFQAWGRVEEIDRGRPDVAAAIFERGVRLAPTSGALWAAWALLEHGRGNTNQARSLFQKATEMDPKHCTAWHSWALLEAERCNFLKAGKLFENGHENDRTDAGLVASWAAMEGKELGNVARARDLFQKTVDIDGQFGAALRAWGVLEMETGNRNQARDLFEKASLVHGEEAAAWHLLGVLEYDLNKDINGARRMWKRAVDTDERHAETYERWGAAEAACGRLEIGQQLFQDGVDRCCGEAERASLLVAWARVEREHGDWERSKELVEQALAADRRTWEAWDALASLENAEGQSSRALELLLEGLDACKGTPCGALFISAAELRADAGDEDEARRLLCDGIATRPADKAVWDALEKLELRIGGQERAEAIAKRRAKVFCRRHDSEKDTLDLFGNQ